MKREPTQNPSPTLLATDLSGSVLQHHSLVSKHAFSYTAYGGEALPYALKSSLGFNGEIRTPMGGYLLGNGYRTYSPTLMRFNSPDTLSPFGRGGINAYSYCSNDPINNIDPSGHMLRATKNIQPSPRQQIESIIRRQLDIKNKSASATTKINTTLSTEKKLDSKLAIVQSRLKSDHDLHNKNSGLHPNDRVKAEESKSAILQQMVNLEKERATLQAEVTGYQNSFTTLNEELDVIEQGIGTTAFNAIYDNIMQAFSTNSNLRTSTN